MSWRKKTAFKQAARAFLLALILTLIPIALAEGIALADRNTRATGFPDRRPVFLAQRQEDGALTLAVFDWSATISPAVTRLWDGGIIVIQTALPHAVKAGAAVIERIIDRCLPPAAPAD